MEMSSDLRLAVAIATKGRASVLLETVRELRIQTRPPDRVLVCYTTPDDVRGLHQSESEVELLQSPPGSAVQRNRIIRACQDCDILLFLDDDFFLGPSYIEATIAALVANPSLVVTTGQVLADGATGPGLTVEAGRSILAADRYTGNVLDMTPRPSGYGCNMAVRLNIIRQHGIEFDERLPLYAWYEDIDFTRRLGQFGIIAKLDAARGVHLGVKVGRTSGRRLGYSQIANPIYLSRKGTYPWHHALVSMARNMTANCVKSIWSEPYVDRRGRLWGNCRALLDLLRGSITPERILDL